LLKGKKELFKVILSLLFVINLLYIQFKRNLKKNAIPLKRRSISIYQR